jgi:BirA family transcriptional regulator, biotin operon repressor / biotin---[acetyl-CoA-carboxylase] ligase
MSDILTRETILAALETAFVGRALEQYAAIGSTNTRAVAWARADAPDGALVIAEEQTAGRGRLGRRWHAPPGSALLLSVVLRPALAPAQAQRATMLCSSAAVAAIRATTGLAAQVKWPNDLVIEGRKAGGVLTELGLAGGELAFVVVGIGLNVNLDPAGIPEALAPPTSLRAELSRPVPRLPLLCALLQGIEARYLALREGWSPVEEWRGHLATLGQPVQVGTPDQVIAGVAEDVDADGALLVRTPEGALHTVLVGDVTLRGERL